MISKKPIKNWHKVERPREKLEKYGPEKLSDAELLAILLRSGARGLNVVEMAKKILRKFKKSSIAEADFFQLKSCFGLGSAKAAEVVACFELGRRFLKEKQARLLLSPEDVWRATEEIRNKRKEHFVVFFLNSRSQAIQKEIVSIGTLNASLVHPREVFEPAILSNAAQIILAHNHPSGSVDPSEDDLAITKRLKEAGEILGIEVIDHVIVTEKSWKSIGSN